MAADLDPRFRPPAELAPAIRAKSEEYLSVVREAAHRCGYAVGVHGSMARDLDLILCPWTADAAAPSLVVRTIREDLRKHVDDDGVYSRMLPDQGPHGRTWANIVFQARHGIACAAGVFPFLDISIMPRLA